MASTFKNHFLISKSRTTLEGKFLIINLQCLTPNLLNFRIKVLKVVVSHEASRKKILQRAIMLLVGKKK